MNPDTDKDLQDLIDEDRRGNVRRGVIALVVIAISAIGMLIYFGQVAAVAP